MKKGKSSHLIFYDLYFIHDSIVSTNLLTKIIPEIKDEVAVSAT